MLQSKAISSAVKDNVLEQDYRSSMEPIIAPPPDLESTVDELRAEIASTRASMLVLKKKMDDAKKG